jgi:hypothetical protein
MELFEAVRHLDPVILTGLPRGNWAADQKVRWAAQAFPRAPGSSPPWPATSATTPRKGDVLVDDQLRHATIISRWEEAGGVFIHHHGAGAPSSSRIALRSSV